jgi:hypothetical protein
MEKAAKGYGLRKNDDKIKYLVMKQETIIDGP